MSSTASDSGPRLRFAGARTAFVAVVATALLTIAVWGDSPNRGRPERAAGSGSSTHIGASSVLLVSALAALVAIRTRLGLRSEPRFLAPLLVEAGVRGSRLIGQRRIGETSGSWLACGGSPIAHDLTSLIASSTPARRSFPAPTSHTTERRSCLHGFKRSVSRSSSSTS